MGKAMIEDIESILLTKEQIEQRVAELGRQITEDYRDVDNLMLVAVLKGSCVFLVDLMRNIDLPVSIDFMSVSSYGSGTKTSGVVRILKDLDTSVEDRDLLVVEDILDSGMTLSYLMNVLEDRKPRSIRIATLLDKPDRRKVDIEPTYTCFKVPDAFVVGYGLDYDEKYRNLPYVGILKPSVYEDAT